MGSEVDPVLYRKIEVWRHENDDCLVRYTCFEILNQGKFCVQSADYFRLPIDKQEVARMACQQIELFIEVAPEERAIPYSSLDQAIKAHEIEFNEITRSE